jgi:hypothetical protein
VEGEDAHFNQLEEDSTQPLSSEATGSLFEVEELLDVNIYVFSVPYRSLRKIVS